MNVLVVSCKRDAWILHYCVRALVKHTKHLFFGAGRLVITVMTDDVAEIAKVCCGVAAVRPTYDVLPVVGGTIALPYHRQQAVKLLADQCVLHGGKSLALFDSDMIFEQPWGTKHNKRWRYIPVEKLPAGPRKIWEEHWLTCEDAVYGDRSGFCFMPPRGGSGWIVRPEWLRGFREMIWTRHGKHVTQLIQEVGGSNEQHFSEFHLLGRWLYENHRDDTQEIFSLEDRTFPEVWTLSGRVPPDAKTRARLDAAIEGWDK